jgi:hypothetical protein
MSYQSQVPSRSDSAWIALSAATRGPWKAAAVGGVIVGLADFGLHLMSLSFALAAPLWLGCVAFFLIGGAGALLRGGRDQARTWAVDHPLRYALVPGAGTGISVFTMRFLLGSSGAFYNAVLAGLLVTVLVATAGYVARAVRR